MNSTPDRAAALNTANRFLEHRAEIDLQRLRNAKQGIDCGEPFAFLHSLPAVAGASPSYGWAGASGDFIEGKVLPEPPQIKGIENRE